MSITVLALLAWLTLIVFVAVPKGMTLTEMVFLYFIIGILTITFFTILDINLHWVPLTRNVEGAFAMYVDRFIVIPFQILLAVCILLSAMRWKWKWGLSVTVLALLCIGDRIYLWANLITYKEWNEFYSVIMYVVFIAIIWCIARWFLNLEEGEVNST